jgi:nucleotide-binding universal stress UspA family protein
LSKDKTLAHIRKILLAVDGSKPSLDAADKAIYLSEKNRADLIVIHVISSDIRYGNIKDNTAGQLAGPLKQIWNMSLEKGQRYLDEVKERTFDKTVKVQTEVLVAVSSVVKEIVEYAEKQDVDVIVIGTRGMSGLKRILLGSTSSGVVTYAPCPVLVVK